VILFIYLATLTKKEAKLSIKSLSLAFIIGGALGNLIDRFRFNFVVDFFDFRLINFAIFNVADIFIVLGSILLVIVLLLEPSEA
jgi:signal peptidase II